MAESKTHTIYRVLKYETDDEKWLNKTLDSSIHGVKEVKPGTTITAAFVHPTDEYTIKIYRNALKELVTFLGFGMCAPTLTVERVTINKGNPSYD